MSRLERLAQLRVKLAKIERSKAGARATQLDNRARQLVMLANGYGPEGGIARAETLAARATFADRLARSGEVVAGEIGIANTAILRAERDVHRAQKSAERVGLGIQSDARAASRRVVRAARRDDR